MKIIMLPRNHQYVKRLSCELEKQGIAVSYLSPFHYAILVNIIKMIYLRMKGFRVIHVHWLYSFPFIIIMKLFYLLCNLLDIKIIWEMHQILPHHPTKKDILKYKWFYKKIDGIVYHSDRDKDRVRNILNTYNEKKHTVIPHGNFNDSYPNTISKEKAREILGLNSNDKVILCFGFVRKNRGYEYLIEATEELKNIKVMIVGNKQHGPTLKMLEYYASVRNNIKLKVGWIPDEKIQLYFNACDFVVLPYTEIYTSGVIPLAYAFSRAVITTDVGNLREVVTSKTGIIIKPKDSLALKNAIKELYEMDYVGMGEYARSYAVHKFNWQKNALKLINLYTNILSEE
jgi:glycosyltransferase involved in cell wall biosynthesis